MLKPLFSLIPYKSLFDQKYLRNLCVIINFKYNISKYQVNVIREQRDWKTQYEFDITSASTSTLGILWGKDNGEPWHICQTRGWRWEYSSHLHSFLKMEMRISEYNLLFQEKINYESFYLHRQKYSQVKMGLFFRMQRNRLLQWYIMNNVNP